MNTSLVPTQTLPQTEGPDWKFLGGLMDPDDLEEGPVKIPTDLTVFDAFVLKKGKVGFPGGIGLKTYDIVFNKEKCLELVLWPYMPDRHTPSGYINVFDPKPTLKMKWCFRESTFEGEKVSALNRIEVEMKGTSLNSHTIGYALKILARARELWPSTV